MAVFFAYPFGVNGDLAAIPNPTQVGGQVSYQSGFTINYEYNLSTNPSAYPIPRTQFNQLMYDITLAIQELQSEGTPNFILSTQTTNGMPFPYDIYARVRYNAGSGFKIYENQVQGNTATPGADATWSVISGDVQGVPPGTIIDFAGTSPPTGYLQCTGAAVSRTTYAGLFAAIGTTWGVGDGSTTFNIPNMARSVKMGSGGTGTAIIGNAVGNQGGEEAHQMTSGELATHSHVATITGGQSTGGSPFNVTTLSTLQNQAAPSGSIAIATTGSSTPFNIIQPSSIMLMCIKY